jgi:hypothetical protein
MYTKLSLHFILLLIVNFCFSAENYWKGTITSNWNKSYNWSLNHVPDATEDVIIPSSKKFIFPEISTADAVCNKLTITNEAKLTFYNGHKLEIHGEANISGNIIFKDPLCQINFYDDVNWYANSQCITDYTSSELCSIYASENWNFDKNSNVVLDKTVCFLNNSSGTSQIIKCKSESSSFYFLSVMYNAKVSSLSTNDLVITNELYISPGSKFYSYSEHKVIIKNNFDYNGSIYFNSGTLVLDKAGNNFFFNSGDYLNNLTVITNSLSVIFHNYADIRGDINVEGPVGISFLDILELKGSFESEATSNANIIYVKGSNIQYFNNLYCDTMYLNKTSGEMRIIPPGYITCDHFDYVKGAYGVYGGLFEINDLTDDGIYGYITVSGGFLNIHQDAGQTTDLNADLTITNGFCNIYGGKTYSYWSFGGDASITMSGGSLNFLNNGIKIYNSPTYSFSENITGGQIITSSSFYVYRSNFTPEGGQILLNGSTNAYLWQTAGSNFFDLKIMKDSKEKYSKVTANSDLVIKGDLIISSGSFLAQDKTIEVAGDWKNSVGTDAFDEGTGKVVFNGNRNQYCDTETFYNLEIDNSGGALTFNADNTITCNSWKYVKGIIHVSGTVTFNDLANNEIKGTYLIEENGQLNIYQGTTSDQTVNMNAEIGIYGGEMNVYGGFKNSNWSESSNTSLTMKGGRLTFWNVGIKIINSAYTFNENITAGKIETCSNFIVERDNFTPENNELRLFGSDNAELNIAEGSCLYNLTIDKSSKTTNTFNNMYDNDFNGNSKFTNQITATSNIDINGDFTIKSGYFTAPSVMNVAGNWNNQAGLDHFKNSNGTVILDGNETVEILYPEKFFNLIIKSTASSSYGVLAEDEAAIIVLKNLQVQKGSLYLMDDANLNVENNLTINNGASLYFDGPYVKINGKVIINSISY